eukprot:CAMPEP_0194348558 /NCGR_PEP_ID=MMETSP0171-20130528/106599_1 /TAXON_ID=218684 /ORGANISM="Corethron pennatum, Strain L29A3" /LENGTH=195 /DNA_ID=CAMNT_0039115909 /DNA_START=566 /DNA_END=1154 /DNA_ORIENTATION=+
MYCARHVVDDLDTPWTETTGSRSHLSRQSHKGEHHPLSVTGELLEDSRAPTPQETVENADLLSRGLFGERMLVEGCPSSKICVGGVYFTQRPPLVVEVTSLRKVCKTMDKNSADRTSAVAPGTRQRYRVGKLLLTKQNRKDAERGRRAGADGAAALAVDARTRQLSAVREGKQREAVCKQGCLEEGAGIAGGERV